MHVRRATAENADAVFGVLDGCFADGDSELWSPQAIIDFLKTDSVRAYIASAEKGGATVGCILARAAAGEAEIANMAVLPSCRRQGFGKALLTRILEDAKTDGIERWSLEVRADNAAARRLYSAAGFAEAGVRKAYYRRSGGVRCDAIIMSL